MNQSKNQESLGWLNRCKKVEYRFVLMPEIRVKPRLTLTGKDSSTNPPPSLNILYLFLPKSFQRIFDATLIHSISNLMKNKSFCDAAGTQPIFFDNLNCSEIKQIINFGGWSGLEAVRFAGISHLTTCLCW